MTSLISKFLASRWVTVALMAALVAVVTYAYHQGVRLGSASEAIAQYEATVSEQRDAIDRMLAEGERRQQIMQTQSARIAQLQKNARLQELAVREALKHADKATKDCMSLHLADSLQFGPSSEDTGGQDQAGPGVDG